MESLTNYFDKGLALVIADIFSLVTVSSCLVLKVPQINTIRANKSSEGISVFGLCLELYSCTVMMSYNYTNNYALLSYMEYPILLIQEYFLVYFVFKYKNLLGQKMVIFALAYTLLAILIYLHLVPVMVFAVLVPFCTPIGATSKVLQLLAILKSKDSSSVSLTTWALSAFTNFTRIYTVYVESYDLMLLSNFLLSFFISSSVFTAAWYYKPKPKKVKSN